MTGILTYEGVTVMVFSTNFNNISAISLVVSFIDGGNHCGTAPDVNHRPVASH